MKTKHVTQEDLEVRINRDNLRKALGYAISNPSIMMRIGLDTLERESQGKLDFVDASSPAALILEMSATMAANNHNAMIRTDSQHYPILTQKLHDLYHHMSDDLYEARFATPSIAKFAIGLKIGQILNEAVESEIKGVKKIVIPRYSLISIDGIEFTFLYPVLIQVMSDGSCTVRYDTREESDIERLESNIINYYYRIDDKLDNQNSYLVIELPLLQVSRRVFDFGTTHDGNILSESIKYGNSFIRANVYLENENPKKGRAKKNKIHVTHSELLYDAKKITARLQVREENILKIDIPPIYYQLGMIQDEIVRCEIFTTHGDIHLPLLEMQLNSSVGFTVAEPENSEESIYSAMWPNMDTEVVAITNNIGGRAEATFDQLKRWVIEGSTDKRSAITHADIQLKAEHLGYNLIRDIDQVTNRIYQAVREIEPHVKGEFIRGAGCSIESLVVKLEDLEHHEDIHVHDQRYTILPSALFKTLKGRTTLLNRQEVPKIGDMTIDQYISKINTLEYIYTPFHYCLDGTGGNFTMRCYYMDNPETISHQFVQANEVVPYTVAVDKVFSMVRCQEGYKLRLITRANQPYHELDYRDLFVQLSYIPEGQIDHAYINGEYIGKEDDNHVWEFLIETTFDFDERDNLILNNFKILTKENRKLSCPLLMDMQVILGMYDYRNADNVDDSYGSMINERAGKHLLMRNRRYTVLAENSLRIKFGTAMTNLWRNTRTVAAVKDYARYKESIPLTYTKDVYELDENGLPAYEEIDGVLNFKILHAKGDPVIEDGVPIMKYRKGDVIYDEEGQPIVIQNKKTLRILDIFFIDGIYRFATNTADREYINSIPKLVVNWLEQDIKRMNLNLMENTHLYFMPKRTMGYINILAENQIERRIFNRLPFEVTYYLTDTAYHNDDVKNAIRKSTSIVINKALQEKYVSKDKIEHQLRVAAGEENIHGVNINNMGLGEEINTFTMLGDGDQCSVRRKIALQADGTLKVKEEIAIIFINHSKVI